MFKKLTVFTMAVTICTSAILVSTPAYAGQWMQNENGWWWQNDDGSYPADRWMWLDSDYDGLSEHYYFGSGGYLLTNGVAPDGQQVDENGAWIMDGVVQREETAGVDNRSWQISMSAEEYEQFMRMARRVNGSGGDNRDIGQIGGDERNHEVEELVDMDVENVDSYELSYHIAELINEERVSKGKTSLIVNEEIIENAMVRAEEASEYFSHTRPDRSRFDTALTVESFSSAENLAKLYHRENIETIAEAAVEGWINSAGHKKNLLDDRWTETGVGVWIEEGDIFISQLFVKR